MKNKIVLCFFMYFVLAIAITSCQNEKQIYYAQYYVNGKGLYEKHCQNCHNKDGEGLGALIPPLTDSVFLSKNKRKLSCIIKNGLAEEIIVNGKVYNEKMPAESHLADIDIAKIITYVTNSFGNKQGLYDVDKVTADLKECR